MIKRYCKMDLKEIIPPPLFDVIERVGISTPRQIMILSLWDIKKLTGLKTVDITLLKNIVAKHLRPQTVTCKELLEYKRNKIKSGCAAIDNLLNGGFRRGVLIEIYGESGSGKTQLGMQVAAKNAADGSIYICTEDLFPITRYNQIHKSINKCSNNFSNNVFVEHVYEASELLSCVRVRLPKLLQQHKASVVIIDSVAAPFRCETTNYIQRAEDLRQLSIMLLQVASDYNLTVLCINQVTANFDNSGNKLHPTLGLAWSNMISYRLWLRKTSENVLSKDEQNISIRELKIIFAPDLANAQCSFNITSNGIQDL